MKLILRACLFVWLNICIETFDLALIQLVERELHQVHTDILMATLFIVVSNIVQHCYTWLGDDSVTGMKKFGGTKLFKYVMNNIAASCPFLRIHLPNETKLFFLLFTFITVRNIPDRFEEARIHN